MMEAQSNSEENPVSEAQEAPVHAARRRRTAAKRYSDYIDGEGVDVLPDAPQWPQMAQEDSLMQEMPEKTVRHHKLLDQMAKMLEPEDEQLSSIHKLPPRVNMQEAYKPAAAPRKPGKRSRQN